MRRDHRPFYLKKAWLKFEELYTNHFLRPHFESLGKGFTFMRPWHVQIFGAPIVLGDYANVVASSDNKTRLSVWGDKEGLGRIQIGDFCLICPGVRISSAHEIRIGNSCMFANGAYVTDSDWHDIYDRISVGKTEPVLIGNNVWVGDGAVVCKGVTIGENSIIGAGAVVVSPVPANCIAAGNPAKVVKQLDPGESFTTREQWFEDPAKMLRGFDQVDRELLKQNSLLHWLRSLLYPSKND